MSNIPKWTTERTEALEAYVGSESPISIETVAGAAESLETSTRSIASKLRKMGFEVELASARAQRSFTDEEAETLTAFVTDNSGTYTYKEVAEAFAGGKFSAKQVQGKILSMELTSHIAPAPKPETQRTYTPEQEEVFIQMVNDGAYAEAIAEAMGKEVTSVRGKALSLLRAELIKAVPVQEHTKSATRTDPLSALGDISERTVEDIAEAIDRTPRGVRTMLTRRGLIAADYDGAARKEKAEAKAA